MRQVGYQFCSLFDCTIYERDKLATQQLLTRLSDSAFLSIILPVQPAVTFLTVPSSSTWIFNLSLSAIRICSRCRWTDLSGLKSAVDIVSLPRTLCSLGRSCFANTWNVSEYSCWLPKKYSFLPSQCASLLVSSRRACPAMRMHRLRGCCW